MISNLNASSEAFLANMDRVQRSVENAGRQTSSGKRVNVASDAPGEIDTILQLRTDSARNSQIQENLSVVKADADAADGALTSATKLMDRARVLAAQGATFTLDATGRQSLAGEVQSLLEQMVAISRTTVQGRYIFGGDQDSTPPYDRRSHRGERCLATHQFSRHTPRRGFRRRILLRLPKRFADLRYTKRRRLAGRR